MQELKQLTQDKLQVTAEKPVLKQQRFLGQMKPHNGHTCYQLNLETGLITEAEFESVSVGYTGTKQGTNVHKKIIVKDKCLYASALNPKNAIKHFRRMLAKAYSNN